MRLSHTCTGILVWANISVSQWRSFCGSSKTKWCFEVLGVMCVNHQENYPPSDVIPILKCFVEVEIFLWIKRCAFFQTSDIYGWRMYPSAWPRNRLYTVISMKFYNARERFVDTLSFGEIVLVFVLNSGKICRMWTSDSSWPSAGLSWKSTELQLRCIFLVFINFSVFGDILSNTSHLHARIKNILIYRIR